jgi:hypothetical protein
MDMPQTRANEKRIFTARHKLCLDAFTVERGECVAMNATQVLVVAFGHPDQNGL